MSYMDAQLVKGKRGQFIRSFWHRLIFIKSLLSVFDQVIVSGTRFATTILVARFCGVDELGKYSLAMSIFMLTFGFQQSLIFGPYTIFRNRSIDQQSSHYSGNAFVLFGIMSFLLMIGVASSGGILLLFSHDASIGIIMILVGMFLPFLFLREFVRQRGFADLNMSKVLKVDGITTVIQLGLLAVLIWLSALDTITALSAAAIAAFISGAIVLFPARKQLSCCFHELRHDAARHWKFGRWSLAGNMTDLLTWQLMNWILLLTLGLKATGLFAACLTIIALANPVVLAVNNILAPRSAAVYESQGQKNLFQMIRSITLVMTALIIVFCVLITIFGETLLEKIYGSDEFSTGVLALSIISLSLLSEVIGDSVHHALRAMDRPDVSFRASFLGLSTMLVLSFPLINLWEVTGAAIALLAGCTTTTILRWISYRNLMRIDSQGGSTV